MITLISKFFVHANDPDDRQRSAWGITCGVTGIILNLLLFTFKLIAGLFSGSIAILADALNNLSDVGSSVVTLVGFRIASQKPDSKHPYGHGRVEYVAGFIVSTLILIMAFELIKDSIQKLFHPEKTQFSWLVIVILAVSICIKFYMAFYNSSVGKKIGSATIAAAATDSISDVISTGVVLLSTIITHYTGWTYLDPICGLAVGFLIIYGGYCAARDTLNPLLGQAPDAEYIQKIHEIMDYYQPEISGVHDIVVHNYGPGRVFVSLHAEVSADGNLLELHDLIDHVEHKMDRMLGCITTIHMDPIVTSDPRVKALHDQVLSILHVCNPDLSIHDFRVTPGKRHTNLIFDVLVPFNFDISEDDLAERVQDAMNANADSANHYHVTLREDTDLNAGSM